MIAELIVLAFLIWLLVEHTGLAVILILAFLILAVFSPGGKGKVRRGDRSDEIFRLKQRIEELEDEELEEELEEWDWDEEEGL